MSKVILQGTVQRVIQNKTKSWLDNAKELTGLYQDILLRTAADEEKWWEWLRELSQHPLDLEESKGTDDNGYNKQTQTVVVKVLN